MATWERIALRAEAEVKLLEEKIERLTKRKEIIPTFRLHTYAVYEGSRCYILTTNTYCMGCNRFLDEVRYVIKLDNGRVLRDIPESQLLFEGEEHD